MTDADHEESSPEASFRLISKLSCSLVGQEKRIRVVPNTRAHRIYGTTDIMEMFACNYGLNAAFESEIRSKDLLVSGFDEDGASRVVELPGHPFFVATLFVPQVLSREDKPHPLVSAFVEAASTRSETICGHPHGPALPAPI